MRSLKQFSKSVAKWTLAVGSFAVGTAALESQALAHFPFHHHHHHHHQGWALNYHGGYSSFYSSYSYYPACRIFPRAYSVSYYAPTLFAPVYYTPTYYAPTYFAPTYYAPTYYAPTCYTTSWSGSQQDSGFPVASTNPSRAFQNTSFAANKTVSNALAMQTRGDQPRILGGIPVAKLQKAAESAESEKIEARTQGIQIVSNKPILLQPYSPVWTKAAVGLVDDMVARGDLDDAYTSCKSMERIAQPKGTGVYLRQALLSYFSVEVDRAKKPSTEDVLHLLELACQGGSLLLPSELAKESLQEYFAACTVDVQRSLDQLSKSVLESSNQSAKDLLLLAALLKLEGQSDRARLFATEVKEQASKSNAIPWTAVLDVCLN